MTHKFVIELTDDCKGYEQDVDYLERIYGAEPIKEHDEEIYNKAIDDFVAQIKNITDQDEPLYNIRWDYIAEQLKGGGENET